MLALGDLVGVLFVRRAGPAVVLFFDQNHFPAGGALPGKIAEKGIEPLLEKTLSRQPAHGLATLCTLDRHSSSKASRRGQNFTPWRLQPQQLFSTNMTFV
jgi:hypothetical protein